MSEIKNSRLGLCGAEYSKCNHMMTLGFKGLIKLRSGVSATVTVSVVARCTGTAVRHRNTNTDNWTNRRTAETDRRNERCAINAGLSCLLSYNDQFSLSLSVTQLLQQL